MSVATQKLSAKISIRVERCIASPRTTPDWCQIFYGMPCDDEVCAAQPLAILMRTNAGHSLNDGLDVALDRLMEEVEGAGIPSVGESAVP
jgi:hypothetical protein